MENRLENNKTKVSFFIYLVCVFILGCQDTPPENKISIREAKYKLDKKTLQSYQEAVLNSVCTEQITFKLLNHYANFTQSAPDLTKWMIVASESGCAGFHLRYANRLMWYGIQQNDEQMIYKAFKLASVDTGDSVFKGLNAVSFLSSYAWCERENKEATETELARCRVFFDRHSTWKNVFSHIDNIRHYEAFLSLSFRGVHNDDKRPYFDEKEMVKRYIIANNSLLKLEKNENADIKNLVVFWSKNKVNLLDKQNAENETNSYYTEDRYGKRTPKYSTEQKELIARIVKETTKIIEPSFTLNKALTNSNNL